MTQKQWNCMRASPLLPSGRCVHRTLQCNGEDDCGDMSDEIGCTKTSKPCRVEAEEYWGIENLAKGWVTRRVNYQNMLGFFFLLLLLSNFTLCINNNTFSFRINVLNSHLEGVVLDNRYYGGGCLPHYIQDVPFRKPFNLQQYTLQVKTADFGQSRVKNGTWDTSMCFMQWERKDQQICPSCLLTFLHFLKMENVGGRWGLSFNSHIVFAFLAFLLMLMGNETAKIKWAKYNIFLKKELLSSPL